METILMKNFNTNDGNQSYISQREYDIKKIKSILKESVSTNTLIIKFGNNWVSFNGKVFNGFNEYHIDQLLKEVQTEYLNTKVKEKKESVKIIL